MDQVAEYDYFCNELFKRKIADNQIVVSKLKQPFSNSIVEAAIRQYSDVAIIDPEETNCQQFRNSIIINI